MWSRYLARFTASLSSHCPSNSRSAPPQAVQELDLECRRSVRSPCAGELVHELPHAGMKLPDLPLLQERHLAQDLGARLGGEIDPGLNPTLDCVILQALPVRLAPATA